MVVDRQRRGGGMAARPATVSEEAQQRAGGDGGAPAAPTRLAGVVDRVLFERAETGYRVLRVTWARLHDEPREVTRAVRAFLRGSSRDA